MLVNNLKITNATFNRSQSKATMTIEKNGFIPCSPLNTVRIRLLESFIGSIQKTFKTLSNTIYIITYFKFQDTPSKGITSIVDIF